MRITIDTTTHTVEVHGTANYEQLTTLVRTLVEQLKWPPDAVQIVQRQPVAINFSSDRVEQRPLFQRPNWWEMPYRIFCDNTTTA